MGLLDEAIREHLELKRRRGGDPTEIARAEREALEPVFPDEPPPRGAVTAGVDGEPGLAEGHSLPPEGHSPAGGDAELGEGEATARVEHSAGQAAFEHDEAPPPADPAFSALGQETAELDVEAFMDSADAVDRAGETAPAAVAREAQPSGAIADELLEWEQPGRASAEPPEQIPGQESLSLE